MKQNPFYKFLKGIVRAVYPRYTLIGAENIPQGPCIIVGNHAQVNGPIISQLMLPGQNYTWCAGEMFHLKEVPPYAQQDFWGGKPDWQQPIFRLASYLIAPLSVFVFGHADAIPVYRDARIMRTMKETVAKLEDGAHIVIFPEGHDQPGNRVVAGFQQGFVDVAKIYSKKTGHELPFVPMYTAPSLHQVCFGEPVFSSKENNRAQEQQRICDALTTRITELAMALPPHIMVPYENIPKKDYKMSRD